MPTRFIEFTQVELRHREPELKLVVVGRAPHFLQEQLARQPIVASVERGAAEIEEVVGRIRFDARQVRRNPRGVLCPSLGLQRPPEIR